MLSDEACNPVVNWLKDLDMLMSFSAHRACASSSCFVVYVFRVCFDHSVEKTHSRGIDSVLGTGK